MARKKKATATQADAKHVAAILEGRPGYRTVTVPVRAEMIEIKAAVFLKKSGEPYPTGGRK
ncbi:MAG TPA: hypothetical protein VF953_00125 [Terriglobales bacterium]